MKSIKTTTNKFLNKLPKSSGVYLFKNGRGKVVYVGRATNLKTRVSSYFLQNNSEYKRPVEIFVSEIKIISFIKTNNLLESAVLENNLIKKYYPKYNVKDKDDKSFVYLFIDMKADFPKPVIIRSRELSKFNLTKKKVLGPYKSYRELKNILTVARSVFPYSTCSPKRGTPCFHNQIGLCPGVCTGEINSTEYKIITGKLISFLKSKTPKTDKKIINDIALMPGIYTHEQHGSRIEGYDISHFGGSAYGAMVVFVDSKPLPQNYRLFKLRKTKAGDDVSGLKEVLNRRLKHKEWKYPNLIVVDGGVAQVRIIKNIIKENKLSITVVGISKAGKHAQSSSVDDKLIISRGIKKSVREVILSQKKLFQRVRNEAHRFSIKAVRNSSRKKLTNKTI
ncbi:GIY-YIG nuclease family protein [Patescibacteria group bacterium]